MSSPHVDNVGFAGLGRMGAPMARRLLAAGFRLTVWNRTPGRCDEFAAAGADVAQTPRALAQGADVIVTMVADGGALQALLEGDDGLLQGLEQDAVLVDMSTIGPDAARAFAQRVAARGGRWVDAPVSGSTALAEQGALTTMIGGSSDAVERVKPVLDAMTKTSFHLGGDGTGAAMKLAVNGVVAVINEALAEGLVLAERSGIPRELAYDVFASGVAASPYVLYKRDAFLRPEETPVAFTVELLRKDLGLILSLADRLGIPTDAVRAANDVIVRACDAGLGDADLARVADVIRNP